MNTAKDLNEEEIEDLDVDESDNIRELSEEYDLDEDEAREVKDIMDEEGLDADEAVEIKEFGGTSSEDSNIFSVIIGWAVIIFIIWGAYSWISGDDESNYIIQEHPNYESYEESGDCSDLEPSNPYDYGTGHYAGFEWAENNDTGYCDGNSDSFIEGCEDYLTQSEAYDECVSNQ